MFIRCNAEFIKTDVSDVAWETFDEQQKADNIEMRKFRVNIDCILAYNEHSSKLKSKIWFKDSDSFVIDLTVDQLDKIMDGIQNNAKLTFKN